MLRRACLALLAASLTLLADEAPLRPANRLARESSPYLLHHSQNPVDWFPWSADAFAKAKKEGKLVFLSSGYHACHWCHVMERESFMDEGVARLLNTHFVCIKLDREERPEVDQLYLTALNAMGHNGGWPLSMFLTADGKPIAGGTYWPREDREIQGQLAPGFKTVLQSVIDAWKQTPEALQQTADLRAEQTKRLLRLAIKPGAKVDLNRELVIAAVKEWEQSFDAEHGGFGTPPGFRGPKFPRPPLLRLLQAEAARTQSKPLDAMVHQTLEKLALAGIYDQIGGGFHRYSTERTWTVPHFEKMLYDNAQLLEVYAIACRQTQRDLYQRVLRETVAFVEREMTSPEGAFYTSLDADTSGEEGRFYVWTDAELTAAVPDAGDRAFLKQAYGAEGPPNFEDRAHILVQKGDLSDSDLIRLKGLKTRLLDARKQRPRPSLDTKVLTSWNGQMIAGMALAGRVLDDEDVTRRAAKAADFLLERMKTPEGRLYHAYAAVPGEPAKARLKACLDDYAYFVHGLLTLHEITGEPKWLQQAQALTDVSIAQFHDKAGGGFYYTADDHETFFARLKDQHDGVQPSANSQTVANLLRLAKATGDARYRTLAEQTFQTFAPALQDDPRGYATLTQALAEFLETN